MYSTIANLFNPLFLIILWVLTVIAAFSVIYTKITSRYWRRRFKEIFGCDYTKEAQRQVIQELLRLKNEKEKAEAVVSSMVSKLPGFKTEIIQEIIQKIDFLKEKEEAERIVSEAKDKFYIAGKVAFRNGFYCEVDQFGPEIFNWD